MATTNPESPHSTRYGFMRDLFSAVDLKQARPNILYGITIALAMATPVAFGIAVGKVNLGSLLAIFGLIATLVDVGGPLRHRLLFWVITVVGLTFCFFLAEIAGQALWSASIFTFAVVFLSVSGLKWGKSGMLCGLGFTAATLIGVSSPSPPEKAVLTILPAFIGSIWGIIISLILQPYLPKRIANRAISACYKQLAAYVQMVILALSTRDKNGPEMLSSTVQAQEEVIGALQTAGQALIQTKGTVAANDPNRYRQVAIYLLAEHITLATGALTEYLWLLADYDLPEYLHTGIIDGLRGEAAALRQVAHSSYAFDLSPLDRVIEAGSRQSEAPGECGETLFDAHLQAVMGEFKSIRADLQETIALHEHASVDEKVLAEGASARQRAGESLRVKPLLERKDIVLIALRVALVETAGVAIGIGFALPKPVWITIPSFAILLPTLFSFSSTVTRTFQRTIGVFWGSLIALALIGLLTNQISLLLALAVLLIGYGSFRFSQYAIAQLFMNPAMLLFTEFVHPGTYGIVRFRLLNTFIGCALAFVGAYHLFPHPEIKQLRVRLARALKANASYLSYLFKPEPEAVETLEKARRQAGIAANLAYQSVERSQGEPLHWREVKDAYAHVVEVNRHLWTALMVLAQRQPVFSASLQFETFQHMAQEMLQEAARTVAQEDAHAPNHPQAPLRNIVKQPLVDIDSTTMAEIQQVAGSVDEIRKGLGLLP